MSQVETAVVAAVVVVACVLRFLTTSPLWLDEALSVNIASLPLGDIPEALRHDGHPPLYYFLLHAWMDVVGDSDAAVRALSGVFALATLPLAFVLGRRRAGRVGGLAALVLVAVAPYLLRYATEARMYALVSLLGLGAWLVADDLWRAPSRARWVVLAALVGAGVLTHYWVLYAVVVAVGILAVTWWRGGDRAAVRRIGSAIVVGSLAFLPWLPSFLYQAGHTGTPWGEASRPTRALVDLAVGLGGEGTTAEAVLFGMAVLVLALVGLTGRPAAHGVELDLRTTPTVRLEMAFAGGVFLVGLVAGMVSASTFVARYGAVFVPLVLVAAAAGVAVLPTVARAVVVGAVVVVAGVGAYLNATEARTMGEELADAIDAVGVPGDVVAFCPDQLGPSTLRSLDLDVEAVGVPSGASPVRIDWVDYEERNRAADPAAVAADLLERAGDQTIWYVSNPTYRTYEGLCEAVAAQLVAARPAAALVVPADGEIFEHGSLQRFDAAAPAP